MPKAMRHTVVVARLSCRVLRLLNLAITGIEMIAMLRLIIPAPIVANWLFCSDRPALLNMDTE